MRVGVRVRGRGGERGLIKMLMRILMMMVMHKTGKRIRMFPIRCINV